MSLSHAIKAKATGIPAGRLRSTLGVELNRFFAPLLGANTDGFLDG
jgi:hypothetical protein